MQNTTATGTPTEATALQESAVLARRFVALAFCRADLLFELDDDFIIRFSAGATPPLFGKNTNELIGVSFLDLVYDKDREMVSQLLSTTGIDGRFDDVAVRLVTQKDPAADAAFAGYRVPDFNNHFFLAIKIAPRRRTQPHRREADRDTEAKVLNKDAFQSVAAERVKNFENAGGEAQMTLVKIDNLEEVKGGLSGSDQQKLMSAIGDVLNAQSLGGDTAGRIDEEHFSIIHDKNTDVSEVGQKIQRAATEVDPSAAKLSSDTTTVDANAKGLSEEQVAKAIAYTMQNFSSGKGVATPANLGGMFQDMMAETMKQVDAFKKICATRNFDLVYMPICELKTRKLHHFEALTRFRGNKSDSSPFQLITLAEEIGVIADFDLAVTQKAVQVVVQHAVKGNLKPLAVNVSGHSIQNADFIKDLHELLRQAQNINKGIMFEITESSEIRDLDAVNATIQEFRTRGFHFALDDFGAGAASFDYLNSFDVDTVKFDGPVVKRAYATEKGKAFLASMATLCNNTGVETIAEMVEDEPLANFLMECGIHLGQGYYFGRPDPDPLKFNTLLSGKG